MIVTPCKCSVLPTPPSLGVIVTLVDFRKEKLITFLDQSDRVSDRISLLKTDMIKLVLAITTKNWSSRVIFENHCSDIT